MEKETQRLTRSKKTPKWYKMMADDLDARSNKRTRVYHGVSEYKKLKVNYDLFNNILNLADFSYVCEPYGAEVGELPAKMVNRDISSGKIKALLGMEMKAPFSYKVVATNPEATTRREQRETKLLKDFVVNSITAEVRKEVEAKHMQQAQGQQMTPEQQEQLNKQIDEETKSLTPDEVKKYMMREHQDPSEIMCHQLLEYLIERLDLKRKFNDCFKHGMLSASEVMFIGVLNGEPTVEVVNPIRFDCGRSADNYLIQDAEWATHEMFWTPSKVLSHFSEELEEKEIDEIYTKYSSMGGNNVHDDYEFDFSSDSDKYLEDKYQDGLVRVMHCVWKSLRKIGFLTYMDSEGNTAASIVDESYKLNPDAGDLDLSWEWIPEVHETWKIGTDTYVYMRPVPGQFKDINNLYECKLPYYGVIYDNTNSAPTALMDRLKVYQYYYNIAFYRLELLMASDKGKKILMNINAVPDHAGMDIEKWQYFLESSGIMWYDPNTEGTHYNDVNTVAKQLDMSLASDMNKYIQLLEFIKRQAGASVGITEAVEGQISPSEAVSNTRQNLLQTSQILEPYFNMHNVFKKQVLQGLIETAKVAFSSEDVPEIRLSYVLDDMSARLLKIDTALLDNSTLGIFVSNSAKDGEAKELITQLAHAALQNQKIELSDVISVIRQDSITEAEETLKASEATRQEREQAMQQQQQQAAAEEAEKAREFRREEHEMEKELIILKESERRETEIIKGTLVGASFNPDQDADNDGENDFIELAKHGLDADIKRSQLKLEQDKLEHQKKTDNKKLELEEKNLKAAAAKNTNK